jgi:hypothetical protein
LGNVMATVSDRKIAHRNNSSMIDYYIADVISAQDYYPFGMIMPGRVLTSGNGYRFSFNTQEKADEIAGAGDHTTAMFWEYDTRLGRRWNLDPVYNASESRYSVNADNPIYYTDPFGDFKTKFGAWLYKIGHGGGDLGRDTKSGQWFVGKQVEYQGEGVGVAYQRTFGRNGEHKPINYGGKNPMTPWDVGVEWLSGTGNREQHFKDGDPFTELYKQHEHVQQTRQMVVNQLNSSNGSNTADGKNPYELKGIEGVRKYIKDYSTLATAGAIGNIAFTYLGSHGITFKITSVDIENRTVVVHFSVHNTSAIQSATRPPVIGYQKWWQNSIGKRLNEQFKSGPMSKTVQRIDWSETIKW